jgi:hypothetical protein
MFYLAVPRRSYSIEAQLSKEDSAPKEGSAEAWASKGCLKQARTAIKMCFEALDAY